MFSTLKILWIRASVHVLENIFVNKNNCKTGCCIQQLLFCYSCIFCIILNILNILIKKLSARPPEPRKSCVSRQFLYFHSIFHPCMSDISQFPDEMVI